MAFYNPTGRANYEPNSWGEAGGPRESPERGSRSFAAEEGGGKLRERGELFADHYSQARQFYLSQTGVEQTHIKDAFTFELSKVETPAIRARMVAHLLNVDADLARGVAVGLGLMEMPQAAEPARPVLHGLAVSDKLSIIRNGPDSFAGRKIGVLVSDGVAADLLAALEAAAEAEGAMVELVAPTVGGVTDDGGTRHPAKQKVNGGPSVLYDAVALLLSEEGAAMLAGEATARDFVADAFAHAKFIGFSEAARPLLALAGVTPDEGVVALDGGAAAQAFVAMCRKLRHWEREPKVHAV
jgi:catalase